MSRDVASTVSFDQSFNQRSQMEHKRHYPKPVRHIISDYKCIPRLYGRRSSKMCHSNSDANRTFIVGCVLWCEEILRKPFAKTSLNIRYHSQLSQILQILYKIALFYF